MSGFASDELIEIKPRLRDRIPRCANCQTGGIHHPLHQERPCIVIEPGSSACPCNCSELFTPEVRP